MIRSAQIPILHRLSSRHLLSSKHLSPIDSLQEEDYSRPRTILECPYYWQVLCYYANTHSSFYMQLVYNIYSCIYHVFTGTNFTVMFCIRIDLPAKVSKILLKHSCQYSDNYIESITSSYSHITIWIHHNYRVCDPIRVTSTINLYGTTVNIFQTRTSVRHK